MIIKNGQQTQAQTVTYLKSLGEQLFTSSSEQEREISFALSESDPSIPPQSTPKRKKKKSKIRKEVGRGEYESPYSQRNVSKLNGSYLSHSPIAFSNELLQRTTKDLHFSSRKSKQVPSRYLQGKSMLQRLQESSMGKMRKQAKIFYEHDTKREDSNYERLTSGLPSFKSGQKSMLQKMERSSLDRLRFEAKQIHQQHLREQSKGNVKERQGRWADFLLRERMWQMKRNQKQDQERMRFQVIPHLIKSPDKKKSEPPTIQSQVRRLKRSKAKLEERVRQFSPQSYRFKKVNIRGLSDAPQPDRADPKVMLSNPRQALFLVGNH